MPERTGSFWSKQAQDVVVNWRSKEILLVNASGAARRARRGSALPAARKQPKQAGIFLAGPLCLFARHGFTPAAQALASGLLPGW
ncbi:MAG: hypothetical protein IPJ94_29625 [Chloroflexi bacterium]|nr:hypothetical protein [Chloroflexota bacterium]